MTERGSETHFGIASVLRRCCVRALTGLAAPRHDGRVTKITSNGNLNFDGLTRLRASCQPLREKTRDLMQVEMK